MRWKKDKYGDLNCVTQHDLKIAIIGTVGIPSRYGGFETLAENLVDFHYQTNNNAKLTVYCSSVAYPKPREGRHKSAKLRFIPLKANGAQSIPYDALSILDALLSSHNRLLLLGVSGAFLLPLVRIFSNVRVVTNIDGIEWKRAKWGKFTRVFLYFSEWLAVRFSHTVIADNQAIVSYVNNKYKLVPEFIAYGGDHALSADADYSLANNLPDKYALALCRIEPENNINIILEGWAALEIPLVFIGNWQNSRYGRQLKENFRCNPWIIFLDSIYERSALKAIRERASLYIHGHSVGGTNPSLVEMMQFGVPILAWDNEFNRYSTEGKAMYFSNSHEIAAKAQAIYMSKDEKIGIKMKEIAKKYYTWEIISSRYFEVLE